MNQKSIKTKTVFIDLDGTIVDSTEAYIQAARIAFQAIGKPLLQREMLLEIPKRMEQNLPLQNIAVSDTKKFLKNYLAAYYSVTESRTKLIPDVSKALQTLSQKTKLVLITMRHAPNKAISKELECFGISQYFNHIVTALDTINPKPSPDALLRSVRTLNVEISDCVMAGDSVNDIRAGKAAGARTVAVLSGLFQRGELAKEKPDLILNDITSLPNFIE